MKTVINIDQWNRKEHYRFFSQFDEPFFGVTVNIDCTTAYLQAKEKGISFFLYYLYRALKAANGIENFRYRIVEKQVCLFEQINASPTINRPDGTFGFSYMNYNEDEHLFYKNSLQEIERVRQLNDLVPSISGENIIHFSVLPWLHFTALSHTRSFSFPDSCPKISFGKMIENNGVRSMPVAIHAHHGLMDGYHVGLFVDAFQNLLDVM